ncbi:MAG: alpha/beta fold hydrolase [Candidatus Acidiferrales bacterium]
MKSIAVAILFAATAAFVAPLGVGAQEQSPAPPPSQSSSQVEASARQVIQNVASGNFAAVESQYDAKMAAALPPGKLGDGWAQLAPEYGAFQSIQSAKVSKAQAFDVAKMVLQFQQGMLDATVAFDPDGKIAGIRLRPHQEEAQWVPPVYAKQSSFTETPLTLEDQGFELPGTLTLPNGPGPFPAIVLVQGSGPHDQDETIGPNKPFKDLAWGLASHGIAVYRYTKRTQQYGEKSAADPKLLTVNDETINDARAAVALVAKQPGVNPEQVYLLGHSLGAYLAPRIATGNAIIAGIVIMGGNTKPIERIEIDQIHFLANTGEAQSAEGNKQVEAAQQSADQIESKDLKPGDTVKFLGATTYGAYWLDLRNYNPVKTAQKLKIPILILQGGRDYQVTPANYSDWQSALGRRSNVTLKLYPDANHLFINGSGASSPKEYDQPGHVDHAVIENIATWVLPSPNPGSLRGGSSK